MNCLIVFAHPEPASFNGALKEVPVRGLEQLGHKVVVSDPYRSGWNPEPGVIARSGVQWNPRAGQSFEDSAADFARR